MDEATAQPSRPADAAGTEADSPPISVAAQQASWDGGFRLVLAFFLSVQLLLIAVALWPACWLTLRCAGWATTPLRWVGLILAAVMVFNYAYLVALLLLRLLIPKPPVGLFPMRPNGKPPREAVVFMLNVMLTQARLQTPWAGIFSSVLVNTFPLHLVYPRFFGPRTPSCNVGDGVLMIDPYFVEAGRSVTIGFGTVIICHIFDQRGLLIKPVRIGDYAVVGGQSLIMPGVEIGHHAIVGARSLIKPHTVIGPYEFWAGTPARKIKDLPPAAGRAAPQADESLA
jgi:acetyltransferase-like isoleucine patch superfamily enzyme